MTFNANSRSHVLPCFSNQLGSQRTDDLEKIIYSTSTTAMDSNSVLCFFFGGRNSESRVFLQDSKSGVFPLVIFFYATPKVVHFYRELRNDCNLSVSIIVTL